LQQGGISNETGGSANRESRATKINAQLINRIHDNIMVQEGDDPAESPEKLIGEYGENMQRLQWLIQKSTILTAKLSLKVN
jgi:hypothetical protein